MSNIQRNVAGQFVRCVAFNSFGVKQTGVEVSLYGFLFTDYVVAALGNPDEILDDVGGGLGTYEWSITQGQSDANLDLYLAVRSTLVGVEARADAITLVPANFPLSEIDTNGGYRVGSFAGNSQSVSNASAGHRCSMRLTVVTATPVEIVGTPDAPSVANALANFHLMNGKNGTLRLFNCADASKNHAAIEFTGSSKSGNDVVFTIAAIDASIVPVAGDKILVL